MGVLSALLLIAPNLQLATVATELDYVINAAATLTAGLVALMAWARYRETGRPDSLLQASAFLVLFGGAALSVLLQVAGLDDAAGFGRLTPGQAPIYIWTAQRTVAALLLLAGAATALNNVSAPDVRRGALIAVGPAIGVGIANVLFIINGNNLPAFIPAALVERLTMAVVVFDPALVTLPMLITQGLVGVLFLITAGTYALLFERDPRRQPYNAYLAVGLIIAAFSQFHFALIPGAYSEMLTVGDVLRVAFYFAVGVGLAAAMRNDLREIRLANVQLSRMRQADAHRIALEERSRLAREIHDGLVQDLWLARLTHGRLAQLPSLSDEARDVADRVDGLLENALAEARQAIVAMQPSPDPSFGSLLVRFVEDIGDRFGLEVECSVEGLPVQLTGHAQAEMLRICREALNNARKHADASLVRVHLESDGATMSLRVSDNGRGFDPRRISRTGFGLQGMHDRAATLGARLEVDSEPMNGTRVRLTMTSPAERAQ
jgi:signal transduction histidine kinase